MDHFFDHVSEFGVTAMGPKEYEERADIFLGGTKPAHVLDHVRSKGDTIRFDPMTNELGVLTASGFIRTYYKPDPATHGLASNMDYFVAECNKH